MDEEAQEPIVAESSDCKWFIGMLADGTYRFITPEGLKSAEAYIGKHGGGVFTHAGYLVFAANRRWYDWIENIRIKRAIEKAQEEGVPFHEGMLLYVPHIELPDIECTFSPDALKWIEQNEDTLKEKGGKYYENIPRH